MTTTAPPAYLTDPDHINAWLDGVDCAERGVLVCPYATPTMIEAWAQGYIAAQHRSQH
jgi:hypothetical protein